MIPMLVDCDTGIDDALALLYLARHPRVDLRAVTSVFGNTDVVTAATNTLRVLAVAGRDEVPVAVGAAASWAGACRPVPHVHGADGLGNARLPAPSAAPTEEPAARLIARTAREHPGELHVLALGPLTNLADALALEPDLPGLVRHVTVMGGAIHHPGNATPAAEANIHNDPAAARAVLRAGWDLTLVPLDVTMHERLDDAGRARLYDCGSPTSRFAAEIVDHYLGYYERAVFGVREAACHDPLAAAIAVGDVPITLGPRVPVDVVTSDGPALGATIADTRGRYRGFPPHRDGGVRVILGTGGTFAAHLIDRLCSP